MKKFRKKVDYGNDFETGTNFWLSFILSVILLPMTMLFGLFYAWNEEWFKHRKVYWEEIK